MLTRRRFLNTCALAGAAAGMAGCASGYGKNAARFYFGACRGLGEAPAMKAAGFDFIESGVGGALIPGKSDEEFKPQLEKLRACVLPIRSCNGFIPGSFRLTGPQANHGPALDYAATACRRADEAGIQFIVLGSGSARNAPEGYDIGAAKNEFIEFCRKLGDRISGCKVTVVLEPLNKKEANYLNTVAEGAEFVDRIDRPRIRLLADLFHMRRNGERADSIVAAGARIRHCHIAEDKGRMAPGTAGEDFSDCFRALRRIGYVGGVSCECGWPKGVPPAQAYASALAALRKFAVA